MRITRRKKYFIAGIAALGLIGSGSAIAYWTTTGSGTGSATVGSDTGVTIAQEGAAPSALAPGSGPQSIGFKITNPSTTTSQYVTSVTVSIASVTKAALAPAGTCDATDFTLTGTTKSVTTDIAPLGTATYGLATSGMAIAFNNKATNQDACKLATVNLAFASV